MERVKIEKLVHGGQGIGILADGRKVFVWNALPGEEVGVRLTKKHRDYTEGVAEDILKASSDRIEPVDEAYLSTSPWQIMDLDAENRYKKEILTETFRREGVPLPDFAFIYEPPELHYRNKMEYSFWADEDGLHLALFHRGSHGKQIVKGSSIARPEIDKTAHNILAILNKNGVRGSQLKTVVIRSNTEGATVVALFVKDEQFPRLDFSDCAQGIAIYFSTPKSPASIVTRELYRTGDIILADTILETPLRYDVNSFFQVNIPVFERALQEMKRHLSGGPLVDMYAGVGSIGVVLGARTLVELDAQNVAMAKHNAPKSTVVVQASTEKALEYITADAEIIFDPPRAGLHEKVIKRLLEVTPRKLIYLSCNPATQARDVARLQEKYEIQHVTGYNFFPRTPHIENLVILVKR